MGARVAAFDWSSTPLGPIAGWPAHLRGAVALCVGTLAASALRWGPERVIIYNDACREVYGEGRFASALGRPWAEVWPDAAPQVDGFLDQLFDEGRPFFATDRLLALDRRVEAEECYFTFSFTPVVDHSGRVVGVFSTFIETTSAHLAERRMLTVVRLGRDLAGSQTEQAIAEIMMQVLAENEADHPAGALFAADTFNAGGSAALAHFGESIGCDVAEPLVRACFDTGVEQHDLTAVSGRSGFGLHAFPVVDPERGVTSHVLLVASHRARPWDEALDGYMTLLARTLAAALLTQSELRAERQRATRASALDAAKSEFFANVSHELRTPLSLISAPIESVLGSDQTLAETTRQHLALAQHNVSRLTRMVEAILDFSRMEARRLAPNLEVTDVSTLTAGLAASFAPAFEEAGLTFDVQVGELSRAATLDPDFFERIVLNLLSNALKFTPVGSVQLTLSEDGDQYVVEVTDTGLGIAEPDREKVFGRFERLTNQSGVKAAFGAGIGLAMVRQLTELLGGTVSLISSLGVGSTFTLRLPFEPVLPDGLAGASITPRRAASFLAELRWTPEHGAPPERAGVARPQLLVVEDDPQLSAFLNATLSDSYDVTVASDGRDALTAMRGARPDIVLTDLTMPNLDGLGLVAAIRADPDLRTVPVVMLSGRAEQDSLSSGFSEGADDYVTKPFSLVDLRARLAANLARALERSVDAEWRRAVIAAVQDGVVVFDPQGVVLELNQTFTDMFGFSLADGPIRPPYPWWPTETENPEELARIWKMHESARHGEEVSGELCFYRRDRSQVWVWSTGTRIRNTATGSRAVVRTLRDISRQKNAEQRRKAAAEVVADFTSADDLAGLIAVAEHGFHTLFEGTATIQIALPGQPLLWFHAGAHLDADKVPPAAMEALAQTPANDARSRVDGILLAPSTIGHECRAWISFPRPRGVFPDELIVADMLAQAFALAVDRVTAQQRAADRETNLTAAITSHQQIGQAVGILVERHRLPAGEAFDLLKKASQRRNLKLRELASRVVETGAEPDQA
ncbi:MAG TPA: ATP-binding protein [Propionicimonas sp.]